MSCMKQLSKIILILFNTVLVVAGLAIIGVCILLKVNSTSKHIQEVIQEAGEIHQFNVAIYAMAGIGAIVLLISLVGCCAAIFESKFLLGLYIAILTIITMAEIGGVIAVVVAKNNIKSVISKAVNNVILKKYKVDTDITNAIDILQYTFNCCGANNYTEYQNIRLRLKGLNVPYSCCYLNNDNPLKPEPKSKTLCQAEALKYTPENAYLHGEGCIPSLENFLKKYGLILLSIGLGITFFEASLIALACCICQRAKRPEDSVLLIS